jgi:hypothetical protein
MKPPSFRSNIPGGTPGIDVISRLNGHGADLKGILAQMIGLHGELEDFVKEAADSKLYTIYHFGVLSLGL